MSEELSYLINLLGDDDPYVANAVVPPIVEEGPSVLPLIRQRIQNVNNKTEKSNLRRMYGVIWDELIINEFQELVESKCDNLSEWVELLSALAFGDKFDRAQYKKSLDMDLNSLYEGEALPFLTDIEILNRFNYQFIYDIGYRQVRVLNGLTPERLKDLYNLSIVSATHEGAVSAIEIIYLIQVQLCQLPFYPEITSGGLNLIFARSEDISFLVRVGDLELQKYERGFEKCNKLQYTIKSFNYFANSLLAFFASRGDNIKNSAIERMLEIVNKLK